MMLTARRNKCGPKTAANSNLVFVEKAPHEDGFAAHFEQYIKPKLLKIEEARLNALAAFRRESGHLIFNVGSVMPTTHARHCRGACRSATGAAR